jgi:hypothetical protein
MLRSADHAHYLYSTLHTWTVVRLTATNFKPLKFSVSRFALPYIADFSISMILYRKKDKESLVDASKEVYLEINIEKTKYMLLSHHQIAGQNRNIWQKIVS